MKLDPTRPVLASLRGLGDSAEQFSFTLFPAKADEFFGKTRFERTGEMALKPAVQTAVKLSFIPFCLAIALLTTGCEQEADRTLASAQACLDQARTAAAANACAEKVAGIQSQAAYLIRCSANFVAQGFTGDRIAKAYERLSDGGSGINDPTLNLMGYLIFQDDMTNINSVATTVNNCVLSGSPSMERLARIADLATSSAAFGGFDLSLIDPSADPATLVPQLKNALDDAKDALLTASPADLAKYGETALAASQSICGAGSSFASNDVCATMNTAINNAPKDINGNVDVAGLADQLITLLSGK